MLSNYCPCVQVIVYLCVYTTGFPWRLLLFTMGITSKQEVMQHCTMVLCLKWNFGWTKEVIQMVSQCPVLQHVHDISRFSLADQHDIQATKVPCGVLLIALSVSLRSNKIVEHIWLLFTSAEPNILNPTLFIEWQRSNSIFLHKKVPNLEWPGSGVHDTSRSDSLKAKERCFSASILISLSTRLTGPSFSPLLSLCPCEFSFTFFLHRIGFQVKVKEQCQGKDIGHLFFTIWPKPISASLQISQHRLLVKSFARYPSVNRQEIHLIPIQVLILYTQQGETSYLSASHLFHSHIQQKHIYRNNPSLWKQLECIWMLKLKKTKHFSPFRAFFLWPACTQTLTWTKTPQIPSS